LAKLFRKEIAPVIS